MGTPSIARGLCYSVQRCVPDLQIWTQASAEPTPSHNIQIPPPLPPQTHLQMQMGNIITFMPVLGQIVALEPVEPILVLNKRPLVSLVYEIHRKTGLPATRSEVFFRRSFLQPPPPPGFFYYHYLSTVAERKRTFKICSTRKRLIRCQKGVVWGC